MPFVVQLHCIEAAKDCACDEIPVGQIRKDTYFSGRELESTIEGFISIAKVNPPTPSSPLSQSSFFETHKLLFCSHNIFGGKKGVGFAEGTDPDGPRLKGEKA